MGLTRAQKKRQMQGLCKLMGPDDAWKSDSDNEKRVLDYARAQGWLKKERKPTRAQELILLDTINGLANKETAVKNKCSVTYVNATLREFKGWL